MNLKQPFFKFPVSRDISAAAGEVSQCIDKSDWIDHPSGFHGNSYIPITSYQGTINNLKKTPVKTTLFSDRLPAVTELLKSFSFTIGISRLMRLEAGYEVPVHSDTNEYWDKRVRVHIPLLSSGKVFFSCGNEEVVMIPGEVWTFNNWISHGVRNEGTDDRVHLVFDTETTHIFNKDGAPRNDLDKIMVPSELTLEKEPTPAIKSGADLQESLSVLVRELHNNDQDKEAAEAWLNLIKRHRVRWTAIEAEFGIGVSALPKYKNAINIAMHEADELGDSLRLKANNARVMPIFKARVGDAMNLQMLFSNAK